MMALNTIVYEKFKNALERRCYQLIFDAYQTSLIEKVIQLDWNENDISSELHRHVTNHSSRLKWRISSNVEAYIPKNVPKVKGFADKFPRIDFRFTTIYSASEYEYFFEAKNLKQSDAALKRRYIKTGIDNFVSKKYDRGSLIGYLIEGETNETVTGINSLLDNDSRNSETLNLRSHWLSNSYYESNHSGIGILKHLILDFTRTPIH